MRSAKETLTDARLREVLVMKKLNLLLALLLMVTAITASGCVVRDGFYRDYRWHNWR
jgi:hypothetical protein